MRLRLLGFPLLLVALLLVPPAAPTANSCGYDLAGAPIPTPHAVPGPWPHSVTSPGSCTSGSAPFQFTSASPACPPPPFIGAHGGQFCGPVVPAGVQVRCTVTSPLTGPLPGLGIVAGMDLNFDGNLDTVNDDLVGRSYVPAASPTVEPYVHSKPARVIAYPLVPLPVGVVFVDCA